MAATGVKSYKNRMLLKRRTKLESGVRSGAVAYAIELTPEAAEHLGGLTTRDRATLLDQLARQLSYEPTVETPLCQRR